MRILIVGGTSFVGRAIAFAALDSGHDVTVINRGQTESDLPERVTRLVGDRQGDMSALDGLAFDVTVDAIAYRPVDVDVLAAALGERGGHHIQISSISAYSDPALPGATEEAVELRSDAPTEADAPITAETYGPLKAACERRATEHFGDQLTLVRPTYVIGSHDATMRFPYWVTRIERGGNVAVAGPRDNALQYIDARDLGEFVVRLANDATLGAFHVCGPYPAPTFFGVMQSIAEHVGASETKLVEVPARHISSHHLDSRFPLWSGAHNETVMDLDPAKALAAGLTLRSLEESVDDVLAWWGDREPPSWWLTREQEAMLVRTKP